jgi:sugar phosphate isomerase/epimerase
MLTIPSLSRRSFLVAAGAATAVPLMAKKKIPIGIEIYSVRTEMAKDIFGPVKRVAQMGYQCIEFFASYSNWSPEQIDKMRKLLDEVKMPCHSTHNGADAFTPERLPKIIEINKALGSKYIVMASPGKIEPTVAFWQKTAETLTRAAETARAAGLFVAYHNHAPEWKPIDGKRPMDILASGTPKDVCLQLDVGTCVEAGADPVAWINANPGRFKTIHCKEYSRKPGEGYKVLFGDGDSPWKQIFQAAEKKGGVEFYLIEQEGHALPPFEAVDKCLANYKKIHG